MPDFTPDAIRDTLTAAGYTERDHGDNITGYLLGDGRDPLGEILVEPHVKLADSPYITDPERSAQGEMLSGCLIALRSAGYHAATASSSMIVITGG